jgi:ABC-type proline/glycine betaine transport system permease subunit
MLPRRLRTRVRDWAIGLCYALPALALLVLASNTEGVVATVAWVAFFVVCVGMIVHGFRVGLACWEHSDNGPESAD